MGKACLSQGIGNGHPRPWGDDKKKGVRDRRRAEVEIKREPHNYPGSVYLSATLSIPVVKPDADVTPPPLVVGRLNPQNPWDTSRSISPDILER